MQTTQKEFLNRLAMLAKACDFNMTSDWAALYDRALRKYGYDRAVTAIEEAIIERRGNERMPSIGDLVQRCSPQIADGDTAVEVAARIWSGIAKFGYANCSDARDWVGEVGWHVVEVNGGWQRLCETAQQKDVGVWKAQLREHAAATLRRHKAGVLGAAPSFGEVANVQKLSALVGQVLNKSEESPDGYTRDTRAISP